MALRSLAILLFLPIAAQAQPLRIEVTGKSNLENVPVRVALQWPKDWGTPSTVALQIAGQNGVGQLTSPSFVNEKIAAQDGKVRKDLVFIAPKIEAGKSLVVTIPAPAAKAAPTSADSFAWLKDEAGHTDLVFNVDGKPAPVLRYMHAPYDNSSKAARDKSYKVFHHVFDPSGTGKIITNGGHTNPDAKEKDLVFPHHRGLMFGFNKCGYDGKTADTWHCTGDAHVSHDKTLFATAGPIMGEHRVLLSWHGPKDEIFATEERQMTVYKVPGGNLIEFATRLTPKVDKVRLDGDPQHAGFQFRASNDVAKQTAKQTYYLRPDGKGNPGETRNWDAKAKKGTNLPWDVLSYVLDGKRYSVEYIDHPNNPGEKRYSERDYGRFGCYFEYDLTPDHPLLLNHRIWVQEGEMTAAQAETLRDAFVNAPTAAVK